MNGISDFAREIGEARVEQEVAAQASKARHAIGQQGSDNCVDCDDPIEPERRKAAPFAKRCITCQKIMEMR